MHDSIHLAQLLNSSDPDLREEGLEYLQEVGTIVDIEDIEHFSSDISSFVRKAFLDTVLIYGEEIARKFAIALLHDEDELVRITAAEVFINFSPVRKNEFCSLIDCLDDSDPIMRRTVAEVFGYAGDKSFSDLLQKKLSKENSCQARVGLAFALYKLEQRQFVNIIFGALESPDYHDRCVAAKMLGELFENKSEMHTLEILRKAQANEDICAADSAISDAIACISGMGT